MILWLFWGKGSPNLPYLTILRKKFEYINSHLREKFLSCLTFISCHCEFILCNSENKSQNWPFAKTRSPFRLRFFCFVDYDTHCQIMLFWLIQLCCAQETCQTIWCYQSIHCMLSSTMCVLSSDKTEGAISVNKQHVLPCLVIRKAQKERKPDNGHKSWWHEEDV